MVLAVVEWMLSAAMRLRLLPDDAQTHAEYAQRRQRMREHWRERGERTGRETVERAREEVEVKGGGRQEPKERKGAVVMMRVGAMEEAVVASLKNSNREA